MTKEQKAACKAALSLYYTYSAVKYVPFSPEYAAIYFSGKALYHAQEAAKARRELRAILKPRKAPK